MLQQSRAWIASNLERHILHRARARARKTGLDFDLDLADIVIPDLCPELGIPLERLAGFASPGTPSIDRIDNSRGYVRGNVRIISFRANQLKRDASDEELVRLGENARKRLDAWRP